MIKHIVMWRLGDNAPSEERHSRAAEAKVLLEQLPGKVESILAFEVGVNVNPSPFAYDLALYSEFADPDGLEAYQKHPVHVQVAKELNQMYSDRTVVDYEI